HTVSPSLRPYTAPLPPPPPPPPCPTLFPYTTLFRSRAPRDRRGDRGGARRSRPSPRRPARAARRSAPRETGAVRARSRSPSCARDRKSTRLNSSHVSISYAVFCLKKKKNKLRV